MMKFEATIVSKEGNRIINEDYCDFTEIQGKYCFAVADGLGGHKGGEIASKVAISSIMDAFKKEAGTDKEHLIEYVEEAQRGLLQYQKKHPEYLDMRTTMVVLVSDGVSANWAHVGDSRLYYFRNGKIVLQSKDHSVPQILVNVGEILEGEIRFHEDRNKLLRVLGSEEDYRPSYGKEITDLSEGDAFLICTDGFWEYILEKEMEETYANSESTERWISLLEEKLKQNSKTDKSNDNYTAIAIFIRNNE